MADQSLTRWQQFYLDDPKLGAIPASACARQAARIFAEHGCQRILDLGCGAGRDTLCLAESGVQVIGLDASRSGLALARQRAAASPGQLSWVEGDARRLPFPDGSFDGVYCFGLLHEFVGERAGEDVRQTLAEIYRMLKPAGVAQIATLAGEPEKGLPHVQFYNEAMFDAATSRFRCISRQMGDDLGCTGRPNYKVWVGLFTLPT